MIHISEFPVLYITLGVLHVLRDVTLYSFETSKTAPCGETGRLQGVRVTWQSDLVV
jgi:hypothetical protein